MRAHTLLIAAVLGAGCAAGGSKVTLTDDGIADAKADAPTSSSTLTDAQAKLILNLVDDACGDAWCEGDYNYAFKRITCRASTHSCTMTVIVIDEGDPAAGTTTRSFWRSCKMYGVDKFSDLVDTAPNGYQGLGDSGWDKIDACMTKIEDSVPAR